MADEKRVPRHEELPQGQAYATNPKHGEHDYLETPKSNQKPQPLAPKESPDFVKVEDAPRHNADKAVAVPTPPPSIFSRPTKLRDILSLY